MPSESVRAAVRSGLAVGADADEQHARASAGRRNRSHAAGHAPAHDEDIEGRGVTVSVKVAVALTGPPLARTARSVRSIIWWMAPSTVSLP